MLRNRTLCLIGWAIGGLMFWAALSAPVFAGTQCPDGSYIPGDRCVLTANGTYISRGGPVGLAPNYKFPIGKIVPYGGAANPNSATLCPNGQYVMGACHLNPDGTYSGGH